MEQHVKLDVDKEKIRQRLHFFNERKIKKWLIVFLVIDEVDNVNGQGFIYTNLF